MAHSLREFYTATVSQNARRKNEISRYRSRSGEPPQSPDAPQHPSRLTAPCSPEQTSPMLPLATTRRKNRGRGRRVDPSTDGAPRKRQSSGALIRDGKARSSEPCERCRMAPRGRLNCASGQTRAADATSTHWAARSDPCRLLRRTKQFELILDEVDSCDPAMEVLSYPTRYSIRAHLTVVRPATAESRELRLETGSAGEHARARLRLH